VLDDDHAMAAVVDQARESRFHQFLHDDRGKSFIGSSSKQKLRIHHSAPGRSRASAARAGELVGRSSRVARQDGGKIS